MNNNNNLPAPHTFMAFHSNHAVSTPEGKKAVDAITKGLPEIKDNIYNQHINPHTQTMKEHFSDHPLTQELGNG